MSWTKRIIALVVVYAIYLLAWNSAFGSETSLSPATPRLKSSEIFEEGISQKNFLEDLKQHIHFDPSGENTIGHILINDHTDGINQSTWLYVKKALEHYKKIKPIFVILELNTPGGEVYAAQLISHALNELDTQNNIPVVAYVNNWAISAGAMLAYSCRFIVTASDGSMGAAEPLTPNSEGKFETASEKVNSALRADFANKARFFGRNALIAEAMVDKTIILVWRDNKIVKLDATSQIITSGIDKDKVISREGKLLTLDAQQMMEYGVADLIIPPTKIEQITTGELDLGRWPAIKSPLFEQPFFDQIPNAWIDSYRMDWKTNFFVFLATPLVSSLLFLGLMLGFYLEVSTPGFGVAGTVAMTCLFLIILSSFSLEIASSLELILLLVGVAVILVELFILPTFGLLGFIGIIFFLMGLFGMMLPGLENISFEWDTSTLNAAGQVFFERLALLCATIVLAFLIILILARFITPSLKIFKRFVLHGNEQVGYHAVDVDTESSLQGAFGFVEATLRPAGKVMIEGTLYDAISFGPLIEKGEPIIVTGQEGGNLIVAPRYTHEKKQNGKP